MYKKIAMACLMSTVLLSCMGNRSDKKSDKEAANATAIQTQTGDLFLFTGTYTSREESKGIYVYTFNPETGKADSVSMAEVENPSYLALSPDEKFLYSVSENGAKSSAAHAFSFDKQTGMLTHLNAQDTKGADPCYIAIDGKGRNVHTANYTGGSISSFQVKDNGSLLPVNMVMQFKGSGADASRQEKPHVHSVMYSPDGKFVFAADLGTDKLYRFTATDSPFEGQPEILGNSLKEFTLPPETGPRHFDFHPKGKYMYLLGELSGQVVVFDYQSGELVQKQTVAADTVGARGSADIHVSPDGRFLYASNRLKNDGIAIFAINTDDGTLTKTGYQLTGRHPRNFILTPNGKFLLVASRDDNKIQVFLVDAETGLLTDTHQDIAISKPVCVKFAKTT